MSGWSAPSARNDAAGSALASKRRDDVEELLKAIEEEVVKHLPPVPPVAKK